MDQSSMENQRREAAGEKRNLLIFLQFEAMNNQTVAAKSVKYQLSPVEDISFSKWISVYKH